MMLRLTSLAVGLALAACGDGGDAPPASKPTPGAAPPATAPAAPAPATLEPVQRTFREWHAVCDNGGRCATYSGADGGGWVMIRRDAGPAAPVEILAGFGFSLDAAPANAALVVDGRSQPLTPTQGEARALQVPASAAAATAARLAAARSIGLSAGEVAPTIPAAGVAAALLWMDERQGRLDTVTALVRRGARPASAVPAAPALPALSPAAPAAQTGFEGRLNPMEDDPGQPLQLSAALQAVPWVKTCLANTAERPYLREAVLAARLGPRTELWGVPCDSGAYNASYLMFVTGQDGSSPRLATLPDPDPAHAAAASQGWEDEALTNPVYDPETRTLSHFPRGRGLGDCGVIQSWTWTDQGFRAREVRIMGDCWGMSSDLWPTTWRTR